MADKLPNGILDILAYLADMAKGYGNHLKWNEIDKLKGDLMNARQRWQGVPVEAITERCLALGMRPEDVREVAQLVTKAQSGRRLIPSGVLRSFCFSSIADEDGPENPSSLTLDGPVTWEPRTARLGGPRWWIRD